MARTERYKDSPTLKRDEGDGKMKATKKAAPEKKGGKESPESDKAVMKLHQKHAKERMEMHHKHEKEHLAMMQKDMAATAEGSPAEEAAETPEQESQEG